MSIINVYCDESCHLEKDHVETMVLGAVWAEVDAGKEAARRLINLKEKHGLKPTFDLKWVTVSPSKLAYFLDVVDYFFDNSALHFRAVVVPDKSILDHKARKQTHDDWFYKMYFLLLKNIFTRKDDYYVYIDIKDTRSNAKVNKLAEVVRNSMLDFDSSIVRRVQQVRSHEVQLLQLADLIMGAIGYANRGLEKSSAKLKVIDRIRQRAQLTLKKSTLPSERKFNMLMWAPREELEP